MGEDVRALDDEKESSLIVLFVRMLGGGHGLPLHEADAAGHVHVALVDVVEGVLTVAALVGPLAAVRLLVLNDVAELGRPDMAVEAREELVGTAGLLVDDELLLEAEVLGVVAEAISDALLDRFGRQLDCLAFNGNRSRLQNHGFFDSSDLFHFNRLARRKFEILGGIDALADGHGNWLRRDLRRPRHEVMGQCGVGSYGERGLRAGLSWQLMRRCVTAGRQRGGVDEIRVRAGPLAAAERLT